MTTLLSERLQQPDLANLPDWEAADRLRQPDASLPEVTEWRKTSIGPGMVMAILGADAGAALLDTLERLGATNRSVRWAMQVILRGELDLSLAESRAQLDALAAAGALDAAQAEKLKAFSRTVRHPSWAEFHGAEATARTVGLARGAE